MIKETYIRHYKIDKQQSESSFRIEPGDNAFLKAATYCVSTGALKLNLLDHASIQLRDSCFKAMVYCDMVKMFTGAEADWSIDAVDIFPDKVVMRLCNDFFQCGQLEDEETDARLKKLGLSWDDDRLDTDDELLNSIMYETESERQQRVKIHYPELASCLGETTSIVEVWFTAGAHIRFEERSMFSDCLSPRCETLEYKIDLFDKEICRVQEFLHQDGCRSDLLHNAVFSWSDSTHEVMIGEICYEHGY